MFDSIQEVSKNKYIGHLDDAVRKFGIEGVYVEYKKDALSDDAGVYFVCGSDKDRINSGNIDIGDILNKNRENRDFFNHSICVFRLNDCNPFATHYDVLEFSRHAEFVRELYTEYHRKIPDKMTIKGLVMAKMLYVNSRNPNVDQAAREHYENALIQCLNVEEGFHNPQHRYYKKGVFITSGFYDIKKSEIANWFKRIFSRDKNRVSLEHLVTECQTTSRATINISLVKDVKKELRKRPDILYWMSKPAGKPLRVPEGEGYGPKKEDNDIRTVEIVTDSSYSADVNFMLDKLCYPEAFKMTPKEMMDKYEDLCVVAIPDDQYENFRSLCETNRVDFCMSTEYKVQDGDHISMLVPFKDIEMLDAILTRLSCETEAFHISLPKVSSESYCVADLPQVNLKNLQGSARQGFENLDKKLELISIETFDNDTPNYNHQPDLSSR